MKKGITPIISIIVLLLITVALAGVAWVYLSGYLTTQISESFNIVPGSPTCVDNAGTNEISVVVQNTGTSSLSETDFVLAQVDGVDVSGSLETVTIAKGQGETLLLGYDCGGTCASGTHTVTLSTTSTSDTRPVTCP